MVLGGRQKRTPPLLKKKGLRLCPPSIPWVWIAVLSRRHRAADPMLLAQLQTRQAALVTTASGAHQHRPSLASRLVKIKTRY